MKINSEKNLERLALEGAFGSTQRITK